jgi:hypothetical protein
MDNTAAYVLLAIVLLAFVLAIRATARLWRIHLSEEPPRSLITGTLFGIAFVITAAGGWYGLMSLRVQMGGEPISELRIISIVLAILILFIPAAIDRVVGIIQRLR